ncbi:MAG: Ig-like domain-containing protein [Prevotella sp.]|nr:Ig-like domain-containing protein [Prevotella sp.]
MKKLMYVMMALLLTLSSGMQAKKVHTLGDSTMAPYDESATNTRGWGMYFGNFLTNGWTSVNYAKGGRDSRGGYNELWQNAKNNVEAGDYVLIQFAHNDEKFNGVDNEELQAYYTAKGDATNAASVKSDGRGTVPSTTYKNWLTKIVNEVKAKGATPILVSAVCRCYFGSDNKITKAGQHNLADKFDALVNGTLKTGQKLTTDDHSMDYSYQMEQLAKELNVAFIDMTSATKSLYESYGTYDKCYAAMFDKGGEKDNTHYNTTGALLAARLCAQLMKEQGILTDNINVPTDLSISPATADMGDGYLGQFATKELTLNGFGLDPATGTIGITATEGILLSTDKQTWENTLTFDYTNGTLVKTFYAKVNLTVAGRFNGTVTATLGSKKVDVPLTVNVVELGGGDPFSVKWALTSKNDPEIEGNALATATKYEGMGTYGLLNGYGALIAPGDGKGGTWAAGIDDVPGQYVQFAVTAPEGKKLDINHIAMAIKAQGGGSLQCHVYYSTDGFVSRKTLLSSGVLTSTVVNIDDNTVMASLDEGEQLLVRIYPWSTKEDKGRWICVQDVVVSGQSKDAAGVNIEGTISYSLSAGGKNQGDDAVFAPTELSAGFAAKKWTAGSALTVEGTKSYRGASGTANIPQTRIYNGTGASFPGTATKDNTLTLTLTPEDGFTFVPTQVSFEAARYGTDGGNISASIGEGDDAVVLVSNAAVNRDGKSLAVQSFSEDINGVTVTTDKPLKLNFSFLSLGNSKEMGLSNVVIKGTLVGTAAQTTKYELTTAVEPAEAGTIEVEPDMASYKEGTTVKLTAKQNFGFRFKEWQDATGAKVTTDAVTTVTMDAAKTMKAVFETVPVYTITTKVTNDAERSLGSITLTPNDHANRYEAGTEITATANESKILKFMQWTDENQNAGTQAVRMLTVDKDMELVANYEVQDFIAVFDASSMQSYAYTTTSGYPFSADLTWDDNRNAKASVVKVKDGSLAYTKDGGTPVVRNREGVVLAGINGLYQNGYRTTDIAWQYEFSTVGFTTATFTADMAAKNMATKNWKALVSTDGKTYEPIKGATWEMTANSVKPLSIDLPATAIGKETVYLRITGDGTDLLSSSYAFDKTFDGLDYCDHSESGVGNVYVLGTAEVVADNDAPVAIGLLPADGAKDVSATGRITISYDERILSAESTAKATLQGNGETKELSPVWSNRSVSFDYMALAYGQTYTFSMPAGFVQDRSGNKGAAVSMTFTVMERQQPQARLYDAVVALDGTGDYTTVQAAIDAAPANRVKPWLIFIKNGQYNEHINIPATKPYLHLIGQQRDKTVILDDKLSGGDNALHVSVGATVVVNADNTFFENLTLENSYGHEKQEGPQALALNTVGDRIALNGVALLSYQDTWITSSNQKARHYIKNSIIEGAVDFIYNGGDVYLDGDTLEINRPSGGYIVAPWHSEETRWGYVFQNNVIRPRAGVDVKDVWLGRPWHGTPKTVFINTQTFVNIPAKGWYNTMGGLPELWADYGTVDANGNPVSTKERESYYYYWADDAKTQKVEKYDVKNYLTDEEAAQYTIQNVMSGTDGWQPNLLCEACQAPVVKANGGKIEWETVPYAICYVITKGEQVVGFTTETNYEAESGAAYRVQAVNEYGGLSQYGVAPVSTGIDALTSTASTSSPVQYYTLDGRQHDKAALNATVRGGGILIVRMADGSVRKVMK